MSADNRPVCGFTRTYRCEKVEYHWHTECPDPPTHAILTTPPGVAPRLTPYLQRAMVGGQWLYACDACAAALRREAATSRYVPVPLVDADVSPAPAPSGKDPT